MPPDWSGVPSSKDCSPTGVHAEGLVIARPSLLLGDREALGQPVRPAERVTAAAGRLLGPLIPANYRPVTAAAVARTLLARVPTARGRVVLLSGRCKVDMNRRVRSRADRRERPQGLLLVLRPDTRPVAAAVQKTTFTVPGMDCPSEENLIRLKLDGVAGLRGLCLSPPLEALTVYRFHSAPRRGSSRYNASCS